MKATSPRIWIGGLGRIRTADLLIKSQLLYQLSYKSVYLNRYFSPLRKWQKERRKLMIFPANSLQEELVRIFKSECLVIIENNEFIGDFVEEKFIMRNRNHSAFKAFYRL